MTVPTAEGAVRTLQVTLRSIGALMVAVFVATLLAVLLDARWIIDESSGLIGGLAAWSDTEGHEYLVIMALTYIPWGLYLWRAAEDPAAHRSLISFTAVSNLVIGLGMAVMAVVDSDHRLHLLGDVPFTLVLSGVLLWAWQRADLRP